MRPTSKAAVSVHQSASSAPLNPSEESLPLMVHVVCPATLPAGYTFEAEINGDPTKIITCEVPEGGVEEGEMILAPLPVTFAGERLKAPTGRWKDGVFDCCQYGFCHPSLWCALCCTQVAMGQVIRRMQLTWLGEPGPLSRTRQAFTVILMLVGSFFVYSTSLELAALPYDSGEQPFFMTALRIVGNVLFTVWSVYALCRTRESVRIRYQIPESKRCQGMEDGCCALFCGCCVAAQLLRHTGEYEQHPGVCCSPTGHVVGTPLTV